MSIGEPRQPKSTWTESPDQKNPSEYKQLVRAMRSKWCGSLSANSYAESVALQDAINDIDRLCSAVNDLRREALIDEKTLTAEKKDYIIQVKYFCRKQNAFGIIGSVEQQVNEFLATIPAEDVVDVIMDSSSGYAVYRKEKV